MITNKTIGITGGNGLIGKALRQSLTTPVKVVMRQVSDDKLLSNEKLIIGNFADPQIIDEFVLGLDVLIHTAASVGPRVEYDINFVRNDLVGSIELAKAFFKHNPKGHFIFLSTAGGLYNLEDRSIKTEASEIFPDNIYGAVKYIVEENLQGLGNVSVLRPAPVYGDSFKKNQKIGLIDKLLKTTIEEYKSQPVEIFDKLNSARDYLHVEDLVNAILTVAIQKKDSQYQLYNVGTGVEFSIQEVLDIIYEVVKKPATVNIVPVDKTAT